MSTTVRLSGRSGPLRMPAHMRIDEAEELVNTGGYEQGDGMRVLVLSDFVLVQIRLFERECEAWVPMADLLNAIARQTQKEGS